MHMLRTSLFAALGLGALAGAASANGFFIYEFDAKANGRGGASIATADGASSIGYNPGGLALTDGINVSGTGALILAAGSYTDLSDRQTDIDKGTAVVPSAFASWRVNEMFAVGVGLTLPFGLALSWPDDNPQRELVQDVSLRSYFITPTVGVNLDKQVPGLSAGAGLDIVPATVELERVILFGETSGNAKLGGTAFGVGGRVGLQYRPPKLKQLHVGATWRSQINLDFDGTGDFDIDPAFRSQLPPDGDISTSVKLPQSFAGGVAYNATPELQFEVNAMWLNWKKFKEIRINLPGGFEPTVAPQDYRNTVTLRVGAEYALPKQKAAVRVGYIYDPTPIPNSTVSAILPDADRHDLTVGGSYSLGNLDLHLAALWVIPTSQTTSDVEYMPLYKGEYEVTAFVVSLTAAGTFGK
jgi:long-chain fatty acid transport protein